MEERKMGGNVMRFVGCWGSKVSCGVSLRLFGGYLDCFKQRARN